MSDLIPPIVSDLLAAELEAERDEAWERFVDAYSPVILKAVRSLEADYDLEMDRYAHVLSELRRDDFRRIRSYAGHGQCRFTTWLVLVVRRICYDLHRTRYGRTPRKGVEKGDEERSARRRLLDLVTDAVPEELATEDAAPDEHLQRKELAELLEQALSELGPEDRLLIRLRYEDGLSAREVAVLLDFPTPFHVYRRAEALLATLRRVLERQGVQDTDP